MARRSRISIAKSDIVDAFEICTNKVFTKQQISTLLDENRQFWRLTQSMTINQFTSYLTKETKLDLVELNFPSKKEHRFTWGDVSIHEIIQSLKETAYFSHYTAMHSHGLTEQIPKTIYFNKEQPKNRKTSRELTQQRIDAAFRQPVRVSNDLVVYKDIKICILHGMATDGVGITKVMGGNDTLFRITDIERTLIDISVRPVYSGGVYEVLKAFQMAKEKASINRLTAILKKLNYIYPYHQVIGFYLEKAGDYKPSVIQLLRQFPMEYDFYLEHNMVEMEYCKEWKLFIPKGF